MSAGKDSWIQTELELARRVVESALPCRYGQRQGYGGKDLGVLDKALEAYMEFMNIQPPWMCTGYDIPTRRPRYDPSRLYRDGRWEPLENFDSEGYLING